MPREIRTRITIPLPAPKTYPQYLVVDSILTDLVDISGGAFYSQDIPPVFEGRWYDNQRLMVQTDKIMVIVSDVKVPKDDSDLNNLLCGIKLRAQSLLNEDVVWITLQELDRISDYDYIK